MVKKTNIHSRIIIERSEIKRLMKKTILNLIKFYQKTKFFRSSLLKQLYLSDAACRFQPTCSNYTYQAIDKYGVLKGSWLGLLRIIRCNPWNKGGYDPLT